jgi:hypothetical protein
MFLDRSVHNGWEKRAYQRYNAKLASRESLRLPRLAKTLGG